MGEVSCRAVVRVVGTPLVVSFLVSWEDSGGVAAVVFLLSLGSACKRFSSVPAPPVLLLSPGSTVMLPVPLVGVIVKEGFVSECNNFVLNAAGLVRVVVFLAADVTPAKSWSSAGAVTVEDVSEKDETDGFSTTKVPDKAAALHVVVAMVPVLVESVLRKSAAAASLVIVPSAWRALGAVLDVALRRSTPVRNRVLSSSFFTMAVVTLVDNSSFMVVALLAALLK